MENLSVPANWPKEAPAYYSPEGWEFEKTLAKQELLNKFKKHSLVERYRKAVEQSKSLLTINWFLFQATQTKDQRYHRVAKRLFEINKSN